LLFLGRVVSFLGSGMAPIALAFAVLELTGSKADLGLVLAARSLPNVLFLLVGGIWADRLPRHQVMVVSSLLSGASQGGVAVLLLAHHARIWEIAALAGMNGAVTGSFNVLGPDVAQRHLGGAGPWGVILAAQNVGLVAGGLLALRFRPRRMLLVATIAIFFGIPELVALGIPLPVLAIAGFALLTGVGIETFGVLWDTTMQQEIPTDKLSRVYSYDALGSFVLIPIGQAASGPVADAVGTRATLFGGGARRRGDTAGTRRPRRAQA